MSSTATPSLTDHPANTPLLKRAAWVWFGVFSAAFVGLHLEFFRRTWIIATTDNNWSHALIVPVISAYYIYQNRKQLLAHTPRLCWLGLPIIFLGMLSYAFWIYPGRNDMFRGYSMIVVLAGLVLFMLGPGMMRVLWFPIAYLAFGIKVSDKLWEMIAWKLQHIAADGATLALQFISVLLPRLVGVENRGSTIDLTYFTGPGMIETSPLNVAEACSGLRMLMAFVALGVAMAFLWSRPWWQRVTMVVMTVPIAIAVNIGRVTVLGVLYTFDREMAAGDFHVFIGMAMLIPAAGLFLLLGWCMDRIIVSDDQQMPAEKPRTRTRRITPRHWAGGLILGGLVGLGMALAAAIVLEDFHGVGDFLLSGRALGGVLLGLLTASLIVVFLKYLDDNEHRPWKPTSFQPLWFAIGFAVSVPVFVLLGGPIASLASVFVALTAMPAVFDESIMLSIAGVVLLVILSAATVVVFVRLQRRRPEPGSAQYVQWKNAGFGIAAGILVFALIGQTAVVQAYGLVLLKKPIEPRYPLLLVPDRAGTWVMVSEDPPMTKEMLAELGTENYISRVYEDVEQPQNEPGRLLRLHAAYYTGNPDTVPHVPQQCFVAGGATPLNIGSTTIELDRASYQRLDGMEFSAFSKLQNGNVRIPTAYIGATVFTFAPKGNDQLASNVIYFFSANGKYLATPHHVRFQGFDPRDEYSYYCKIEVQVIGVADPQVATERASDLLSAILPEIMACLPDWDDVREGRYPVAESN